MPQARWNGQLIASSDTFEDVEGNVYVPPGAVDPRFLRPASQATICPWKGTAHSCDVVVDGQVNAGAAWYDLEPKPAARQIKDHAAFWRGVAVTH
jgi:Uncharacterized protein conserved in bacteria